MDLDIGIDADQLERIAKEERERERIELMANFEREEAGRLALIRIERARKAEEEEQAKLQVEAIMRLNIINEDVRNHANVLAMLQVLIEEYKPDTESELFDRPDRVSLEIKFNFINILQYFNSQEREELTTNTLNDTFQLEINQIPRKFMEYIYTEQKFKYLISVNSITIAMKSKELPAPLINCFQNGEVDYERNLYTRSIITSNDIENYEIFRFQIDNFMPQGEWCAVFPPLDNTIKLSTIGISKFTSAYFIFYFKYMQEFTSRNDMYYVHSFYVFDLVISALKEYDANIKTNMFVGFVNTLTFNVLLDMKLIDIELEVVRFRPYQFYNLLILTILKMALHLKYQSKRSKL